MLNSTEGKFTPLIEEDEKKDDLEVDLEEPPQPPPVKPNAILEEVKVVTSFVPVLIHVLCLLGGIGAAGTPIYNWVTGDFIAISTDKGINFVSFKATPFQTANDVALMIFGFLVIGLELSWLCRNTSSGGLCSRNLAEWFMFITTMPGRGVFLLFVGSFLVIKRDWINQIIGVYVMALGLACLLMGFGTGQRVTMFFEDEDILPQSKQIIVRPKPIVCAKPGCSLKADRYQCPQCFRLRIDTPDSYFCSQAHFEDSWKKHKEVHKPLENQYN
jgi:hypothetical protein